MDGFAHPVLLFGFGPATGLAVGLLLTRPLLRRGQPRQAVLAGLLALAVLFGLQQLSLRAAHMAEFADTGPCLLCYEWSWIPYVMNWASWSVGAMIFAVVSLVAAARRPPQAASVSLWNRRQIARLAAGMLVVSVLAWGADQVMRARQRSDVAQAIQQPGQPIAGVPTVELGGLRLPAAGLGVNFVYASGLSFSPDGHWLVVHRSDGWNLRRLSDFRVVLSGKNGDQFGERWIQFNPNGSLLAIIDLGLTNREENRVYRLNADEISLAWEGGQGGYRAYQAAFSPDGEQIRILDSSERLISVDARTGQVLDSIRLSYRPPAGSRSGSLRLQGVFSPSGAYLALADSLHCGVGLFAAGSGEQLDAWDPSEGACPGDEDPDWGYAAFRPGDQLVWILEYDQSADQQLWSPSGSEQPALENALAQYPDLEAYAITRDLRLAAFAQRNTINIWDLERGRELGSLETNAVVTALEFSPDGALLAVGTADSYLRFFSDQPGG